MAEKYYIKISKKYELPTLLTEFAQWLKGRPYGDVGWFEFIVDKVPSGLIDKKKDKPEELFSIFHLPDGSVIALDKVGSVLHFDSEEKGAHKIAKTLMEFLKNLSNAKTGVDDLDEESDGRKNLKKWLEGKNEIKKEKKDLKKSAQQSSISYKDLLPAIGKEVESTVVKNLLTQLQAKSPVLKKGETRVFVTLSKQGINMILKKITKNLELVAIQFFPKSPQNGITEPFPGELPSGLQFLDSEKEVYKKLGKPSSKEKDLRWAKWKHEKLQLYVTFSKDFKAIDCISFELK